MFSWLSLGLFGGDLGGIFGELRLGFDGWLLGRYYGFDGLFGLLRVKV